MTAVSRADVDSVMTDGIRTATTFLPTLVGLADHPARRLATAREILVVGVGAALIERSRLGQSRTKA